MTLPLALLWTFLFRVVPSLNKTNHTWLLLTWKWRPRKGHWYPFLWPLSLLNNPLGWGMFCWFSLLKLIITTYCSTMFNSMHSTKKNIYSITGCALVMIIIHGGPSRFWNIPYMLWNVWIIKDYTYVTYHTIVKLQHEVI